MYTKEELDNMTMWVWAAILAQMVDEIKNRKEGESKIMHNRNDVDNTEILKLKSMLEEANIPFEYTDNMFGGRSKAYQIVIFIESKTDIEGYDTIDAVCNFGSYGHAQGLIEIMGGLTEEENKHDDVLGYLTADEVFKRFKYCYENSTCVYKEEKENV